MIRIKKEDFCNKLRELGYTKNSANEIYSDFVDVLIQSIIDGETIKIQGLGEFSVKHNKGHKGYNFNEEKVVDVPPKKKICFKPSITLKESVEDGKDIRAQ